MDLDVVAARRVRAVGPTGVRCHVGVGRPGVALFAGVHDAVTATRIHAVGATGRVRVFAVGHPFIAFFAQVQEPVAAERLDETARRALVVDP